MKPSFKLFSRLVVSILFILILPTPAPAGDPEGSRSRMLCLFVRTACHNYRVEYKTLPDTAENNVLAEILCGKNVAEQNRREIAFLELRPNQLNEKGQMIDEWGTPLVISFPLNKGIQVVSAGKDKVLGTPDDLQYLKR